MYVEPQKNYKKHIRNIHHEIYNITIYIYIYIIILTLKIDCLIEQSINVIPNKGIIMQTVITATWLVKIHGILLMKEFHIVWLTTESAKLHEFKNRIHWTNMQ